MGLAPAHHRQRRQARPTLRSCRRRRSRRRRPSRYKLEAEAASAIAAAVHCPEKKPLARNASLSLFDRYEIERITSDLDTLIHRSRSCRKQSAKPSPPTPSPATAAKASPFWARHAVGFCRPRADAVGTPVLFVGHRL
ncbi:unnamed protein product [Spirodela intermedia]|uniref:Uncharacterized protein n=1 Tax=Spirodela intermedia TaxID=51605 RepID=A0A7I8J3A3_SPIIN|nr:unnamed protein product [Spirodela intermedia]CAA6664283.1 unnamed protein product [Spirodela intermedia]